MRMSQLASMVVIMAILLWAGLARRFEDDSVIIRNFVETTWGRSGRRLGLVEWALWCKAGIQLGEFTICPPR